MNKKDRLSRVVLAAMCVMAALAVFTLTRFPGVNLDEVDNAAISREFIRSGRIQYTPMRGTVDPAYEELSMSHQGALRGPYAAVLGAYQKVMGSGFFQLRALSLALWLGIGLFFLKTSGVLAALLWLLSLDSVLAGRLIRPDIFMAAALLIVIHGTGKTKPHWPSFAAGFAASLAAGFHPHGLALVPLALLLLIVERANRGVRLLVLVGGLLAGLGVDWIAADFPTYELSKKTYAATLYAQNAPVWVERLHPVRLLSASVRCFTEPASFYLSLSRGDRIATTCAFFLYLLSALWALRAPEARSRLKSFLISGVYLFLAVGYGHFRQELIYNVLVTAAMIPVAAWALSQVPHRTRKMQATLMVLFAVGACSAGTVRIIRAVAAPTLGQTIQETDRMWKEEEGIVLGPYFYWFRYGDRLRDASGLHIDHVYSGEKRPAERLRALRPAVVIADEDFRRRYQLEKDGKGGYVLKDLVEIIPVPSHRLGLIPPTPHHSGLEVIAIDWSAGPAPR